MLADLLFDEVGKDLLWEYRNAHGAIAIERGKETFRMIKVLKSAGSVALLIDQDTKVKTVFVDFFGMPAATPVGATVLALKTGASVVPTYIYLGDDGMQHMHILPEIPMRVTGDEESDRARLADRERRGWCEGTHEGVFDRHLVRPVLLDELHDALMQGH